jgi:DNA-directed RNA polymerase subunit M/transcription elongation factor TFIIS
MLYNYCPKCGSLRLEKDSSSGNFKCKNCEYFGEAKRDSIDKINSFKKVLNSKNNSQNNRFNNSSYLGKNAGLNRNKDSNLDNIEEDISLKEKLSSKFSSKKSGDWELL